MNPNRPMIKMGLFGGRGMGKTVFLVSLKEIPSRSYDFGSLVIKEEETLRFLTKKHDELEEKGRLPSTTHEEMRKIMGFNFIIKSTESNQAWNMVVRDYAGELIESFHANESLDTKAEAANKLPNAKEATKGDICTEVPDEKHTLDKITTKDKRKLKKWLSKCDVLVMLVPADIDELIEKDKDSYEGIRQYRSMMSAYAAEISEMAKTTGINIPVILAISKWDIKFHKCLTESGKDWEYEAWKFLAENKELSRFSDCLKNAGISDFKVMPFSAFGRHRNDECDKFLPGSEPFGVLQLIIRACNLGLSAQIGNVAKRHSFPHPFWHPCNLITWQRYASLLRHGISDPNERQAVEKLDRDYRHRFVQNAALSISVALICLFILVVGYRKWEHITIHKALTTNAITLQTLGENRILLDSTIPLEKTPPLKWLLNWKGLDKLHSYAVNNYIAKIDDKLRNEIVPFKDDKMLPFEERIRLSEKRSKLIKAAMPMFPFGFQKDTYVKQFASEKAFRDELELYGPFDRAFEVLSKKPDNGKVAEIEKFILLWDSNKYFERNDVFKELANMEARVEASHYKALEKTWNEMPDIINEHWQKRIDLAEKRKSAGQSKLEEFRKGSHYRDLISYMKEKDDKFIEERKYNGPFEDAFANLKLLSKSGKGRKIDDFITSFPRDKYISKKGDYDALAAEKEALEAGFDGEIKSQIDDLKDSGVAQENWELRISNANERIKIITKYKTEFSESSKYLGFYEKLIADETSSIKNWTECKKYSDALKELNSTKDSEVLAACDKFISDWDHVRHLELKVTDDVRNVKQIAEQRIWDNLEIRNSNFKDMDVLQWKDRDNLANNRIAIIEETRKYYPTGNKFHQKLTELHDKEKDLIVDLEHYGSYDDALNELRNMSDVQIIGACDKFLSKYPPKDYKKRNVEQDVILVKNSAGNNIWKRLELDLNSCKDNSSSRWDYRKELVEKRISLIKESENKFTPSNPWAQKLAYECSKEVALLEYLKIYGPFDDEYDKIINSISPVTISVFLEDHTEKLYPERKEKIRVLSAKIEDLEKSMCQSLLDQLGAGTSKYISMDISDSFVLRIKEGKDPLSAYLKNRFTPNTVSIINAVSVKPLTYAEKNSIAAELNDIISGDCIYDDARFPDNPVLAQEIKDWKADSSEGKGTARVNRYLLEYAYPELPKIQSKSDDPKLHWMERQKYAEIRIQIIENAKIEFSRGSRYHVELDEMVGKEKAIIEEMKFYGDFDDRLDEIKKLADGGKIQKIIDFESKYPSARYPKRTKDFTRLKEMKDEIESQLHSELLNTLRSEDLKDVEQLPWRNRSRRASDRIETVGKYEKEFQPGSNYLKEHVKLIEADKASVIKWKLYGAFDDEYKELCEGLPKGKIRRINSFLKKYSPAEYKERADSIKSLKEERTRLEEAVKNRLSRDLKTSSDDNSRKWIFRASMAEKRIDLYECSIAELAINDSDSATFQVNIEREKNNAKDWHRYAEIQRLTSNLEDITINGIYELLGKYPPIRNPDVGPIYIELEKKKAQLVKSLFDEMNARLKDQPLLDDKYSIEEQQERIGIRISIIDAALSQVPEKSSEGGAILEHQKLADMRNVEESALGEKKKYKDFDNKLELVKSSWGTIKPSSKIEAIDNFILTHSSEEYPYRKAALDGLGRAKNEIQLQIRQEKFKNTVSELISKYPNGDEDGLYSHVKTAKTLIEELSDDKFKDWIEKDELKSKLDITISAARKELDGYLAVSRYYSKYISNPTKENYDKFMSVVDTFKGASPSEGEMARVESNVKDVQYVRYAGEFEKARTQYNAKASQESYEGVNRSYDEFVKIGADDRNGSVKAQRDSIKKNWSNIEKIRKFSEMTVALKYLDVEGSRYRDNIGNNEIEITVRGENIVTMEDMRMGTNKKAYDIRRSLRTRITGNITITLKEIDYPDPDDEGSTPPIPVQAIFDLSGNRGSVTHTFLIKEGEAIPAKVTLEFSGLPIFE